MPLFARVSPFGAKPNIIKSSNPKGFHIEPLTDDIEKDFELFAGGSFAVNLNGTKEWGEWIDSIIGDITPSRIVQGSLRASITNPLVKLIGMENYYISMYDAPETLHKIMEMTTALYERYYDYLEKNGLLYPSVGFSGVSQESYDFTYELPSEGPVTSTTQKWGFLESQETTAVSPDIGSTKKRCLRVR